MKPYQRCFICLWFGMAIIAFVILFGGCAHPKKPVHIPEGVPLHIRYNPAHCKTQVDQSVTCKDANFSAYTRAAQ